MKNNKLIDISAFRHLYPFESHYMDLKGLKYHYVDEGSGEAVVMLHGNPTWSFYFRNLILALSPRFRTIAPDHIGCGLSDKPSPDKYDYRLKNRADDLEQFLSRLNIKENISLIVHDWGGMIGLLYALRYPEKIRNIVIMNTAGFFPPQGKRLPLRLRLIRNILFFSVPAVLGLNLFSRAALCMASHKGLSQAVKTGLTAPYNSWNNRIATLEFVRDIPVSPDDPSYSLVEYADDNLHRLSDKHILICWGRHDFVFDMSYFAEWKRRFPHAEARLFPDAGHYVLEDAREEMIPIVKDFLNA